MRETTLTQTTHSRPINGESHRFNQNNPNLNLNLNLNPPPPKPPPPDPEQLQLLRDDHRTRHGKIAKLPLDIRDELCERLEQGQQAPELLDWLHSLPEVRQTLDDYFDGVPINKQNLAAWRQGGYLEWQLRQELAEAAYSLSDTAADVTENGRGRTIADNLAHVLAAQFCSLLTRWDGEPDPKFEAKLRLLERLNKAIALLQKTTYHTLRQQAQLDRDDQADAIHQAELHKQQRLDTLLVGFEARKLERIFGEDETGKVLARHIAEIKAGVPTTYDPKNSKPAAPTSGGAGSATSCASLGPADSASPQSIPVSPTPAGSTPACRAESEGEGGSSQVKVSQGDIPVSVNAIPAKKAKTAAA